MNINKITTKFLKILSQEKDSILLWMPVFLGIGIVFFFSFPNINQIQILFSAIIFLLAIALFYFDRFSYRCFIYSISSVMLLGFLWSSFYQKFFVLDRQLTGKVFVDVKGEVLDIRKFNNPINNHEGLNLLISNPVLYKAKFNDKKKEEKKIVKKKQKKTSVKKKKSAKPKAPKEKKMTKKFLKLIEKCEEDLVCIEAVKQDFLKHEAEKKLCREERYFTKKCGEDALCIENLKQQKIQKSQEKTLKTHTNTKSLVKVKKPRKISEKQIEKNFLNLADYQEIDREFLDHRANYQQVKWQQSGDYQIFPNPPKKVSILTYSAADLKIANLKIGDVVFLRASLEPPPQKEFLGGFDYGLDAASKGIGGYGRGIGKMVVLYEEKNSSFENFIANLRKSIEEKITAQIPSDEGAIAAALMVGTQSLISKEAMTEIRNSGLAHLLSISGLHMAIAAAIFFAGARFLLSRSEYLALHFNIKKIAAIAAIISAYFYLELADAPVPAVRSFIMVVMVLAAILIDLKADAKRSIALAAFVLLLFNPYNIFSISFQLSFAAILSLACFYEFALKLKPNSISDSLFKKFLWYFLEIALASIVVQIATMPFLIYHFKNFSTYGLLSNMLAIPLTTFITMPLGFLAIFLMPLGLEKFVLQLMGISISWVIDIANFISSLKYSYFITPQMPKFAFILAVISWLIMCLVKSNLRWLGAFIFAASFNSLIFVKHTNLLFDGEQKFFAIYDVQDGLVFSEKLRPSKKRNLWMKEMNENQFKYFEKFSQSWREARGIECDEKKCEISNYNKKILVLFGRNKLSEICSENFDIIVNLTSKYKLPECFSKDKIIIDNANFYQKGGHFLYFDKEQIRIETARKSKKD